MKVLKTTMAAAGLVLFLAGATHAQGKVLAKVDGVDITEQDLEFARAEIGEQLNSIPPKNRRKELLLYVLENRLLAQAAKKEKLDQGPDAKALKEYYDMRALHDVYYQKKIRDAVDEGAAKKLYDEQVAKIEPQEEFRARHILVKTEEEAYDVIERINRGDSFEDLAKELSTGPSGAQGGDLGYSTKGRMVPEFEKAALALKKGEVSEPVQTQFGWHVIKLEDKRMSKPPAFEEVKDGIQSGMVRQKAIEVIGDLRKDAEIDILDMDVKKALEEALKQGAAQ